MCSEGTTSTVVRGDLGLAAALAVGLAAVLVLAPSTVSEEPVMARQPDYDKLDWLARQKHHPYDSFSLTMCAAAMLFGKEADYETVYALSTNAFAPDIRPDEECRSTWRFRGRGQCLGLVAARLGLAVRPIGGFTSRRYGDRSIPGAERLRRAAAAVRPALERGEVVITDSGWLREFWLWGIVREVRDDGTMIGATPNGLKDNTFDHPCSFWALIPTEPTLSEHEADVLMLRRAVSRIRADDDPFLPESLACGLPAIGGPAVPGAVVWGLPAMDLWIAQMEKPVYQEDDPGSSEGNAHLTAYHTLHGAEVAAAHLRKQAPAFAVAARPHLEAAAQHYDRIAALLAPAVTGEGGEGYERIMGDARKQKAHANVLRQVKTELAAAADEMEKALAAEAPVERGVNGGVGRVNAEEDSMRFPYRAADRIRDDLRNFFNWGRGVYAAPGITPENEKVWAGIFDLPLEQRLAAFAAQAEGHGCTQATVDEAILWLSKGQKIDAMFYLVDQRDVRGIRRFLDLLHETKSPLSFIIIRCEKIYDVLSFQPDWYIRHNNQFETAKPEALPPDPEVRKDLLNINWDQAWDDPAALYASPFRAIVEAHERLSDTYGCIQKVEGDRILWSNHEGDLEAMFVICDDTDLDGLRRIYRAIEEKNCPLTWLFLRLSHWQVPVFDILSLSKNHYLAHRNRIGDWH